MSYLLRKYVTAILASIVMTLVSLSFALPANATAQTCISAPGSPVGYMCTTVEGSGTYVSNVYSTRGTSSTICNYSAWFFRVEPSGTVRDIGSLSRAGCNYSGRAYLMKSFNQSFAHGTQMCTKFYENNWGNFIGQKCVGLS